jgi:DNA polymerase-1
MRGYAATSTGLRRHRASRHASPSTWERNWLTNHPVQGSAAVVFKAAGNRLDRLYRRYDAWMLIALHDELVFEAPLDVLGVVAELTGDVMCQEVEVHFPVLRPRVEVNIHDPACWNKDGHSDSVDRWIEDPMYRL